MIKILLGFILLIIANIVFAEGKISAVIPKGQLFLASNHHPWRDLHPEKQLYFPENHYKINSMVFTKLNWIKHDDMTKKLLTLPGSYTLLTKGSLDFESYDPRTGNYKFKLTIKPIFIHDLSMAPATGYKRVPIKINTDVIFTANNKPYMYVEGIARIHNKKLILSNIHTNRDNSSFNLSVDEDSNNLLILRPNEDIHVSINVTS